MILHASVVADEPRKTAETLARLLGGIALPLGPGEGTWSAIGPDPIGNLVSVLERGSEFHRTGEQVDTRMGARVRHSAYHLLIETRLSEAEVLNLAAERECHALKAKHGAFDVIEFWIDDCLLIEVVTPDMGRDYRELIESDELRQRLAPVIAAGLAREAANAR
jgi:hypothetical protein